jgi:hypothetical protein
MIDIGAPWKVLPPGVHEASLTEVDARYGMNEVRKKQMIGLRKSLKALQGAGCKAVFLDGSFVTEKENPGDFDLCWLSVGVDERKLDPVILDCSGEGRNKQKAKYDGEFFPLTASVLSGGFFFNFFQKDKFTQKPKGIIRIALV